MYSASGTVQSHGKTAAKIDLVQDYLDSLLREVGTGLDDEALLAADQAPLLTPDVNIESATLLTPQSGVEAEIPALPTEVMVVQTETVAELAVALDPAAEREVPDWARQGFAGLVFEVAGLRMAAPLHALGGITLIEDKLQPVAGQADWFMGLLRWNGRNLRVIDTARFVMPERVESNAHHDAYQSVIVLGDSHWALAVDSADESVNLGADEIRWKKLNGTRPWLAGTLLQRLCALVDVDNLMSLLQQHEQQIRHGLGSEQKN